MSYYTHHLDEMFPPTRTSEDKRALDGGVRVYLGMDGVRAAMREND